MKIKKFFRPILIIPIIATSFTAGLSLTNHKVNQPVAQHKAANKSVVSNGSKASLGDGPYEHSSQIDYSYDGTSDQDVHNQYDYFPKWDANFTQRNINVEFNFRTWNDHKLDIAYPIFANNTGKDETKVLVDRNHRYPDIYDLSGLAVQEIIVTQLEISLTTDNVLRIFWNYSVFSHLAANDLDMMATVSW